VSCGRTLGAGISAGELVAGAAGTSGLSATTGARRATSTAASTTHAATTPRTIARRRRAGTAANLQEQACARLCRARQHPLPRCLTWRGRRSVGARRVVDIEPARAMAPLPQQPSLRRNYRRLDAGAGAPLCKRLRRAERELLRALEIAEPRRRGAAVDKACGHRCRVRGDGWCLRLVFARIEQHVTESEVYGTRALQGSRMVTISKQAPMPPQRAIDGSRHAHRKALHAQRQRAAVARLRDQMEVIALHREMYEAKAKALTACSQRKADLVKETPPRSEGTPAAIRSVTCTGWWRDNDARRR